MSLSKFGAVRFKCIVDNIEVKYVKKISSVCPETNQLMDDSYDPIKLQRIVDTSPIAE